jgi:hypothetical protein
MRRLLNAALLFLALPLAAAAPEPAPDRDPAGRQIAVFPSAAEAALRENGVEIWDRDESYVLAGVPAGSLSRLEALTLAPLFSAADRGEGIYILSHIESFVPQVIPGVRRFIIEIGRAHV